MAKKIDIAAELNAATVEGKLADAKQIYDSETGIFQNQFNKNITDFINKGYLIGGVANIDSKPDSLKDTDRVVWIANEVGTYLNYGGLSVEDGEIAIFTYNGSWSKITLSEIAQELGNREDIAVSQKRVSEEVKKLENIVGGVRIKRNLITPQYNEGAMHIDGTIKSTSTYGYYAPILLKKGDSITINNGNAIYCGYSVAVVYSCDENGIFQKTLINDDGKTKVVSYTNDSDNNIYIGVSCYKSELSYFIDEYFATLPTADKVKEDDDNFVTGGVVFETTKNIGKIYQLRHYQPAKTKGLIRPNGEILDDSNLSYSEIIEVSPQNTIYIGKKDNSFYHSYNVAILSEWTKEGVFVKTLIEGNDKIQASSYTNSTDENVYVRICTYTKNVTYDREVWEEGASMSDIAEINDFINKFSSNIEAYVPYPAIDIYNEVADTLITAKYPLYSYGNITDTSDPNSLTSYYTIANDKLQGMFSIKAYLAMDGSAPAAIAFYTEDSKYIKASSVQHLNTYGKWFEAIIPENAYFCRVSNKGEKLATPQILVVAKDANLLTKELISIKGNIDSVDSFNPIGSINNGLSVRQPYYYHFEPNAFIRDGQGNKAIASQTADDIILASRLGFTFIEANVQNTADGDFVVMHGSGGNFGSTVYSLDGTDISTTPFTEKTTQWIKDNVRFNSYYDKYKVAPLTLKEFCQCCKENNIGIFAGTNNQNAIDICKQILGTDNVILYGAGSDKRALFKGMMFLWTNSSTITPEDMVSTADTYGLPFMYGLGPTTITALLTNNELERAVKLMHEKGYTLASTAVYDTEDNVRKAFKAGVDYSASGWQVNAFEPNYKVYDINDGTIGTANVVNGVITLNNGDSFSIGEEENLSLAKVMIIIKFTGNLRINIASLGDRYISSDGTENIVITDYLFKDTTQGQITATSDTTINDLVYKISKC